MANTFRRYYVVCVRTGSVLAEPPGEVLAVQAAQQSTRRGQPAYAEYEKLEVLEQGRLWEPS